MIQEDKYKGSTNTRKIAYIRGITTDAGYIKNKKDISRSGSAQSVTPRSVDQYHQYGFNGRKPGA